MIGNNWDTILKEEFEKEYFKELMKFVSQEYKNKIKLSILNKVMSLMPSVIQILTM